MSLQEQTAWDSPRVLRTNRPQGASKQSVGHQTALHPEDTPHYTTDSQSRKPARIVYDDEDEVYTDRRMPTVTKRYNRSPVVTQTHVREEQERVRVTPMRFFIIALGIILLAFVLAALIIALLIPALNRWNDDRTYGYPRTIHQRANVGHGTTAQPYSDFTGENINGYMYVIELEETDPTQSNPHVYFVTRYSGVDKDMVAITDIAFQDENGDGKVDMLVTIENGSMFVLYNNGKSFTLTAPK
jgi:hypothetical protein